MNQSFEIRKAEAVAGSTILALVQDAYGKYIERIGRPPLPMADNYDALIGDGVVWVLVRDGKILGVLVLRDNEDHLLLENVAVSPAFQGEGLGRQLLDYTETEARDRGYGEVRLYTNEAMTENIALYKKWGYTETFRESGGFRRVFMSKRIP